MDQEQREAFATLHGLLANVAADARSAAANASEAVSLTRRLDQRVGTLERRVFGSDPPPDVPSEPIARQVSEHDGDIATLTGQVIAVNSKVDALTRTQNEQLVLLNKISSAVGGVLGNPLVRRIAWGVGVGLAGWMSTKGWLHQ